MDIRINQIGQLEEAAKALLEFSAGERLFLFFGDMGAGKTTFIKSLCALLGLKDTVSSPTYSIVNEYRIAGGTVYHFDFYRLKSTNEALDIGFEEYLYSGNYCLIEWPEKIAGLWPLRYMEVRLGVSVSGERHITATLIDKNNG